MSKAKEKYYSFKKDCDMYFEGVTDEINDYIQELEQQNEEMLECLIKTAKKKKEECPTCNYACTGLNDVCFVMKYKGLIEKITGRQIYEAIK